MPAINTRDDWWNCVDGYWDALTDIVGHHMDLLHPAYEKPGNAGSAPTGRDIGDEMEFLRKERDPKLVRYFHATWAMASETYARERHYGWGALCDLCSEEYVLHGDEPNHPEED